MNKITGSLQIKGNKYYVVWRDQTSKKYHWIKTGISVGQKRNEKNENRHRAESFLLNYFDSLNRQNEECQLLTTLPNKRTMLFTDYLLNWLKYIKPFIKSSTYEGYEKMITGQIIPFFHDKGYRLCDLNGVIFSEYFVYLKNFGRLDRSGGLSRKSILNIRAVLSSAFKDAVTGKYIDENFIDHSRLPLLADKKREYVIYSPSQIKLLLEYAKAHNSTIYLFILIVATTGIRRGECCGLTWEHVNTDQGFIKICLNRSGNRKENLNHLVSPKTSNGYRTLYLPEIIVDALKNEKALQQHNRNLLGSAYVEGKYDYVIRKADGSVYNPNSITRILKRYMTEAGLPVSNVQNLRHSVASFLFNNTNVPLKNITTQLGHGETRTTETIYVQKDNVTNYEQINAIAKAIGITE